MNNNQVDSNLTVLSQTLVRLREITPKEDEGSLDWENYIHTDHPEVGDEIRRCLTTIRELLQDILLEDFFVQAHEATFNVAKVFVADGQGLGYLQESCKEIFESLSRDTIFLDAFKQQAEKFARDFFSMQVFMARASFVMQDQDIPQQP